MVVQMQGQQEFCRYGDDKPQKTREGTVESSAAVWLESGVWGFTCR